MFETVIDEYSATKRMIERESESYLKNLRALSDPMTKEMLHNLNDRVVILHNNQILIERETKELRNECIKFYKEAGAWIDLYNNLNDSLKELGDVVNWANVIQEDLKNVAQKLK